MAAPRVNVQRLVPTAALPEYMTEGAAGADLRAAVLEPLEILPGRRAEVPTGIAIELPSGFEAQVRPRSGLAAKYGVTLLNSPGTIDSDYRGEIRVLLINHGEKPFVIEAGDRIAQLVVAPVVHAQWGWAEQLKTSKRGQGGFGHTG